MNKLRHIIAEISLRAGLLTARICALPAAILALAGAGMGVGAGATMLARRAEASQPKPWQLNAQEPATVAAEQIVKFHDYLLWLTFIIVAFVLALLIYVCIRFREQRNPTPSRTTHNTLIEVLWTVVPVIILVIVAIPSFQVLYFSERTPDPDMTIKVTANQWYWNYEYPDDGFNFDSTMLQRDEIDPAKDTYLLSVDQPLVLPVGQKVQVLVTSNDVMHAFFVPSATVQIYGIQGRINEAWMQFTREGTFYGQCNQICGTNHAAMPIAVEVLSAADYAAWLTRAKVEFAAATPAVPAVPTDHAGAAQAAPGDLAGLARNHQSHLRPFRIQETGIAQ